uniref:Calmodulin-lysine N-methyltransferase n=1 Tax=Entomoneis paludosa TaxID=265537 RepID=A0A7S2YFJ5_9STRA
MQCVMVSDHDVSTLERARNNHETTLENLLDTTCTTEDDLNATINSVGSIPLCFESLEWGNSQDLRLVQDAIAEHSVPRQRHADLILGSDVIYDTSVVEPLLRTVQALLGGNGRFLLAQSFAFDQETEVEMDRCCEEMGLKRTIVLDEQEGDHRIQEFCCV